MFAYYQLLSIPFVHCSGMYVRGKGIKKRYSSYRLSNGPNLAGPSYWEVAALAAGMNPLRPFSAAATFGRC